MKKIFSFLMLLCVAKGNPVASWGGYQWNMPYQWHTLPRYFPPLLGPFFRPPGQVFSPPEYNCPPSGYINPIVCQELVNLQNNQQSNTMDNKCSIELVCRNSETGDITSTTPYKESSISSQDNSTNPVTSEADSSMTEEPPHHGGAGNIDIRSSQK